MSMRLLASQVYRSLAAFVIKCGGVYLHRWTDQTFFPLMAALLGPNRTAQLGGLRFEHGHPNSDRRPLWVARESVKQWCES